MSDTQTQPTDEQARDYALGHFESIAFMTAHLNDDEVMIRSMENAAKFASYIRTHKLPWAQASLEKAFHVLREAGELKMEPNSAEYPELEAPPVDPVAESFPWGQKLTREVFKKMSGEEMRRHRNPRSKWSEEFNKQLAELGIQI